MKDPTIIKEILRISKKNGGVLLPADVLESAKDVNSPLHSKFEWDESKAAYQWNLQQARQLIRVAITFSGPNDNPVSHRVFVSLTTDRKEHRGYRVMNAVLNDEALRAQLLADAMDEMKRFQEKYRRLNELALVLESMQEVINEHSPEKETGEQPSV